MGFIFQLPVDINGPSPVKHPFRVEVNSRVVVSFFLRHFVNDISQSDSRLLYVTSGTQFAGSLFLTETKF